MNEEKTLPGACSARQQMYLDSTADVTLFGGAMGGGKSEIGVIDFLQYTDIPNFKGIITRRTTPQLNTAGGILGKCQDIFAKAYEPKDFTWRAKDGKFVFHKSGAEIYLKHFESESTAMNWNGVEANLFLIDEGSEFTQFMVQKIMSRMRNPRCPEVSPRLKITTNPNCDHFFRKWVEPYLFQDGTPDRSKDGLIRYFTFYEGGFIWGDTKEEVVEKTGANIEEVLSFTFISATVDDNPILKKINPKYVGWLKGLTGVERKRNLEGNWFVREESSSYFNRKWLTKVQESDLKIVKYVRAWDIAGTLPSDKNPNPDWTAGVLMGKTEDGKYVILDVVRFREQFGGVLQKIVDVGLNDPDENYSIILPQEPGQAGLSSGHTMMSYIRGHLLPVRMRPSNKSKLTRFQPFSSAAEMGSILYVEGEWNDMFFNELEAFDNTRNCKDDQLDATSDAFITLAQNFKIPDINFGAHCSNLTTNNYFT
jgi:predicted phage terminase large subunit-like protein